MTTQLAPYIDGIPAVVDTVERNFRFPAPDRGQRVHNLALGTIERWTGVEWITDFTFVPPGTFAPYADGIPIVLTTAERDALFPDPVDNQRVFNVETGQQERWTGTEWVSDFEPEGDFAPIGAGIPVVLTTAARDTAYPAPATHQRVFNVEVVNQQRFNGAAWVSDFVPRVVQLTGSDAGPATGVHLNFNTSALATGFLVSLDDFASAPLSRLQVWKNGSEEKMRLTKEGLLTLTPNSTVSALAITPTGGFQTNIRLVEMTATWNNAAVTFGLIRVNVTDVASGIDSRFIDYQIGGVSKFAVRKDGAFVTPVTIAAIAANTVNFTMTGASLTGTASGPLIDWAATINTSSGTARAFRFNITNTQSGANSPLFDVQISAASALRIDSNGAGGCAVVASGTGANAFSVQRHGTTTIFFAVSAAGVGTVTVNTPTLITSTGTFAITRGGGGNWLSGDGNGDVTVGARDVVVPRYLQSSRLTLVNFADTDTATDIPISVADTWSAGAITRTAVKVNITDTASAVASLLLDLQVGGVSKFAVRKDGVVTVGTFAPSSFTVNPGPLIVGTDPGGTELVRIGGNVNLVANANIKVGGVAFIAQTTGYHQVIRPDGSPGLWLGAPTDKRNYYDNDGHRFRSVATATLADLTTTNFEFGVSMTFTPDASKNIGQQNALRPNVIYAASAVVIGADLLNGTLRVNGTAVIGNTFVSGLTGTLHVHSTGASGANIVQAAGGRIDNVLYVSTGGVDEKRWDWSVDGVGGPKSFAMMIRTDAGVAGTQWFRAIRSGAAITFVEFGAVLQLAIGTPSILQPISASGVQLGSAALPFAGAFVGSLVIGTDPGGTETLRVGGSARVGGTLIVSSAAGNFRISGALAEIVVDPRAGGGNPWELYVQTTAAFRLFHGASDQFMFSDTEFAPSASGGKTLGTSALPFSTAFLSTSVVAPLFTREGSGGLIIDSPGATGFILFRTNGPGRWFINQDGHFLANTDNAWDFGAAATARPRTVYVGTSLVIATDPGGAATSALRVGGSINLTTGQAYRIGDTLRLSDSGNYTVLGDASGSARLFLGNAGDASNYYDNGTHRFRTASAVGIANLNSSSFAPQTAGAVTIGTAALPFGLGHFKSEVDVYGDTSGALVGRFHANDLSTGILSIIAVGANAIIDMFLNGAPRWRFQASGVFHPNTDNLQDLGGSGLRMRDVFIGRNLYVGDFAQLVEIAAPATPPANTVRLYARDVAGVSELFYKNDAGSERVLSPAAPAPPAVRLIHSNFTNTSTTTTGLTDLASFTIPANTLAAAGQAIRITAVGAIGNGTATKTVRFLLDTVVGPLQLIAAMSMNLTNYTVWSASILLWREAGNEATGWTIMSVSDTGQTLEVRRNVALIGTGGPQWDSAREFRFQGQTTVAAQAVNIRSLLVELLPN